MLQTVQTHREVFSLFVTIIRLIPLLRYPEQKKKKKKKKKGREGQSTDCSLCVYMYVSCVYWSVYMYMYALSKMGGREHSGPRDSRQRGKGYTGVRERKKRICSRRGASVRLGSLNWKFSKRFSGIRFRGGG